MWPRIEPLVAKGIAEGPAYWWPQDVFHQAMTSEIQIWGVFVPDLAMIGITRLVRRPRMMVCHLELAAGTGLDNARLGLETIEEWARAIGCDVVEFGGRVGWGRVHGWTSTVSCWKELV